VLQDYESDNRNVSFIDNKAFWFFYITLIFLLRLFFWVVLPHQQRYATTVVHLLHSIISFRLLHWNKGSLVIEDTAEYEELTFWEQIDDGNQFTMTRKLFTVVPILIFLWAEYDTNWEVELLVLNSIALAIILIGKSPYMHRVRILGINEN